MGRISRSGSRGVVHAGVIVFAIVAVGGFAPTARAQQNARLTSRSVTAYGELLGLGPEQTEIARALHDGYLNGVEAVAEERRGALRELKTAHQGEKHSLEIKERVLEITTAFENESARVEAAFFRDLRLVLDEDQAVQWPRVERLRRRETTLRLGWYSGDGIDLIAMTRVIAGERDLGPEVEAALETYELQIDRALVIKARELAEMLDAVSDPTRSLAPSDYAEMGQTKRSVGLHVRNVNRRHARVIESLLPEDIAPAFHDELLRRSFPKIYRESRTDRLFTAADRLDDLSIDQRVSLGQLRESYRRQRVAANGAWSAAIIEREEDGGRAGSAQGKDGGRPDADTPLDSVQKAQRAGRELDERYAGKVIAILSPSQQRELPTLEDPATRKSNSDGKGW